MQETRYSTTGRDAFLFDWLVSLAREGQRAPAQAQIRLAVRRFGNPDQALLGLITAGKIRISVYAKNWRVITIMTGPYRGCSTARPPIGSGIPYLITDAQGTRVNGVWTKRRRAEPGEPSTGDQGGQL